DWIAGLRVSLRFQSRPSEREPDAELRLPREATSSIQVRQHEERRRKTLIAVADDRQIEVRTVGDVEDVEEQLQGLVLLHLEMPPRAHVGLEIGGTTRAVALARELHVLHGV